MREEKKLQEVDLCNAKTKPEHIQPNLSCRLETIIVRVLHRSEAVVEQVKSVSLGSGVLDAGQSSVLGSCET